MNENERDFESQKVSQGDKGPTLQSKKPKTRSQDQEAVVAALKESEERYKAIFERQLEAVYICDFEGNFIDANPAALNMLGYDKEEIRSLDFEALITPTQIPKAFETLKEIIETGSHKELKEYRLRHKDGHYIDIETKGSLIYRNGEPYAIQGTARDITQRKKVEGQLTEQNRFLKNVLESLAHPFYVVNAHDYTIESTNSTANQMGIIDGQKCHNVTHGRKTPCHSEGQSCPLDEVKRTKEPVITEYMHKDSKGNPIHVEIHAYPIFDSQGEVDKVIEYTLDITERKNTENALWDSQAELSKIFNNIPILVMLVDNERRVRRINRAGSDFTGRSEKEMIGLRGGEALRCIHSLDDPKGCGFGPVCKDCVVRKIVLDTLETNKSHHQVDANITIIQGNHQKELTLLVSTAPVSVKGDEMALVCLEDITVRKQAEEALKKETLLSRTFMDAMPSFAMLLKKGTREIVAANKVAKKAGAKVGMNCHDVFWPFKEPHDFCKAPQLWETGEPQHSIIETPEVIWDAYWVPLDDEIFLHYAFDITEKKKAEQAIEESEGKFRELTDLLPQTVFELDMNGNITYTNQYGFESTGYSERDIIDGFKAVQLFVPEDQRRVKQNILKIFNGEELSPNEYSAKRKDGSTFPVLVYSRPVIRDEKPIGLRGIMVDITERKKAEEALRKSEDRYRKISELISDFVYAIRIEPDGTQVPEWSTETLKRILGMEYDELLKEGGWQKVIHPEDLPIVTQRTQNLAAGKSDVSEYRVIAKDGEVHWVRDHGYPIWDEKEGRVVNIFGAAQDITERKKAEEAIRESEEKFRTLFELSPYSTVYSDLQGNILACNNQFTKLHATKKGPENLVGRNVSEFFPEEEWPLLFSTIEKTIKEEKSHGPVEYVMQKEDGAKFTAEANSTLIKNVKGEPFALIAIANDITERKKAEHQLKILSSAVEQSANSIAILDKEGIVEYVNPKFLQSGQFDKEKIIGKHWGTFVSPQSSLRNSIHEIRDTVLTKGNIWKGEVSEILKNGQTIWIKSTLFPIKDEKGTIERTVYISEDISEQKKTEQALRESQERLLKAQHIAHLGFWEWDLKTSELYWSDEAYHIFGLEVDKVNPTYDDFLEILHPQDKESVVEAVDAAMHGKSDFNVDHRIILPSGLERYVTSQGELIRDEKGTPIKMMGTMIDITDRKKAEKETKKRNEELYTLNTISSTINQTLELKEVLSEALEETISVLNVEGGLIYLADRSSNNFSPAIYYGFSKGAIDSISGFSIGEGISGQAAQLGVPLFVPNLSEDAQHISSAFLQDGWDSLVSVPLNSKGKVVGVMTVSSREKNKFKPEDIGLLRSIGNQIGVAIENARLYSFSQDELAERRRAEKKVSQQNKFLKSVLESLTHPFYVVNVNNNLIEVANSVARAKGLTVGSTCNDIIDGKDNIVSANGYFCPIDDIKQTKEPKTVEHFFYDETGNMKYNEVHAYPIFDEKGEVKRVIEYAVDITDRKRAEAGLKERDAQLRSVVTAAPIALWSLDKEGKFTLSEGKALDALGQKPGQVVGESVYDVYRDAPQILDDNKRALKGEEFSSSLVLGDLVWETYFSPLKDQKGKVMGTIGVATDITKRRRAESEREILFRELKHRVKNNLQLLSSMVDMQILRSDNKAVRDKLQEIQSVIDTIALIYTRAYEGSKLVGLNLNNFIEEIITASMKFKVDDKLHISHTITGDQIKLNTDSALPMALIANELVFNALKHAFSGKKTGNITVSLKKVDGHFTMSIADDGVGMNPEIDLKKPDSFGLKIIKNLIEQLNGTIETVVDGGTEFIIRIPMEDGE